MPGDKRQRTRAQLIASATAIVREKGFHAVSLEAVAERVGMSRGAIYGNFRDKEDLIFAVLENLWQPVKPALRKGAPLREQLHIMGKAVAAAAKERRPMAVGAASFQVFALSHPKVRKRIAVENARIYAFIEKALLEFISKDDLPMPIASFVRATHAMSEGFMFGHFMAPEEITEEVIVAAFEALAGPSAPSQGIRR